MLAWAGGAFAQDAGGAPASSKGKSTDAPEEDDFRETPYTKYGEFNNDDDEEEELKYMQYGRFFGVALGLGYEGALGNKGDLYTGGFPVVELKVVYWFDFNFALTLGVMNSNHSYGGALVSRNDNGVVHQYDLNLFRFGVDLRYYFDVRDATAAITFANPFITGGVSSYTRTLTPTDDPGAKDTEGSLGYNLGAGFEFILKPRKAYFNLEGRVHQVNFSETSSRVDTGTNASIPDQSGLLYSVVGSILFTW